jgi:hypothetical protein
MLYEDTAGKSLRKEFARTRAVIVPIFDGTKALSSSMRDWISANFPGLLDGMDGPGGDEVTDVRISCSKWWHYCDDSPPAANVVDEESPLDVEEDRLSYMSMRPTENSLHPNTQFDRRQLLYFHMAPIVKRSNHRKHNSHQWFFDALCEGLDDCVSYAFLTDCGTTYTSTCLARLTYELHFKKDLIGVTARQRVETPNEFFRPCEDAPFSWLQGDHSHDSKPCWRCYLTYLLSPCPLQGFEFEATLIMNSAMFNLVEALPVSLCICTSMWLLCIYAACFIFLVGDARALSAAELAVNEVPQGRA